MPQYTAYYDLFTDKLKHCKTKKEYKKLCKEMLRQFDAIDKIEHNQWKIFSSTIGSDAYLKAVALSVKMYILEQRGISCDILTIEDPDEL